MRHVPEVLARLDAILDAGMTEPLLMRAARARRPTSSTRSRSAILDPFLYVEADGRKVAVIGVLERDRIEALRLGIEVDRPVRARRSTSCSTTASTSLDAEIEIALRACRELGVEAAIVPPDFPLAWADKLRGAGIELTVDDRGLRRCAGASRPPRSSTGIRRAQGAADAAMGAAARLLRELPRRADVRAVRGRMQAVCDEHGAELPDDVDRRPRRAVGRRPRVGPRPDRRAASIVLIDIWPRDKRLALLGGHDAHVRRRRRGAARRAARSTGS